MKEKRRESEKEKRLCLSPVRLYAKKSRGAALYRLTARNRAKRLHT